MPYTELQPEQLEKTGALLKPIIPGYNSVFFHPLTARGTAKERKEWGLELTTICKKDDSVHFYWFDNNHPNPEKREIINVYPNAVIEEWWASRH